MALQVAHDRTGPERSPTNSPPPTSARPCSARSRPRRGSTTPKRSRPSKALTLSGSAISICPYRSACPASSIIPNFTRAIDRVIAACAKHKKALGRLVPTVEQGIELYAKGFDFICYSGDVWVLHNALAEAMTRNCATASQRSRR